MQKLAKLGSVFLKKSDSCLMLQYFFLILYWKRPCTLNQLLKSMLFSNIVCISTHIQILYAKFTRNWTIDSGEDFLRLSIGFCSIVIFHFINVSFNLNKLEFSLPKFKDALCQNILEYKSDSDNHAKDKDNEHISRKIQSNQEPCCSKFRYFIHLLDIKTMYMVYVRGIGIIIVPCFPNTYDKICQFLNEIAKIEVPLTLVIFLSIEQKPALSIHSFTG